MKDDCTPSSERKLVKMSHERESQEGRPLTSDLTVCPPDPFRFPPVETLGLAPPAGLGIATDPPPVDAFAAGTIFLNVNL